MGQNRRPEAEAEAREGSSSEEEEEEGSSEENEEQEQEKSASESESEEKEDETSTPLPKKPSSGPKKTGTTQTSAHPQSLSSDDDDSGSESDSDSPPHNTRRADPSIKPIASKPMEEPPKATKKPRSKPGLAAQPSKSLKRTVESENNVNRESKRAKKKALDADGGVQEDTSLKKTGDDSKKQLFQRLWSEDDEIAILKGMTEYTAKKGADPAADMNAFHDFIKKSLHVDVSKSQLSDKVRRLKKKYENNASKGKTGEDRTFSKLHDQKVYDLSKKIWCGETNAVGADSIKVVNGKARKNRNENQNERASAASPKIDGLSSPDKTKEGTKMIEVEPSAGVSVSRSVLRFNSSIGGSRSLEEVIIKDGLELISGPKKLELEERWKKLKVEEVEFYLKRVELIREQAKLVLEALK